MCPGPSWPSERAVRASLGLRAPHPNAWMLGAPSTVPTASSLTRPSGPVQNTGSTPICPPQPGCAGGRRRGAGPRVTRGPGGKVGTRPRSGESVLSGPRAGCVPRPRRDRLGEGQRPDTRPLRTRGAAGTGRVRSAGAEGGEKLGLLAPTEPDAPERVPPPPTPLCASQRPHPQTSPRGARGATGTVRRRGRRRSGGGGVQEREGGAQDEKGVRSPRATRAASAEPGARGGADAPAAPGTRGPGEARAEVPTREELEERAAPPRGPAATSEQGPGAPRGRARGWRGRRRGGPPVRSLTFLPAPPAPAASAEPPPEDM